MYTARTRVESVLGRNTGLKWFLTFVNFCFK